MVHPKFQDVAQRMYKRHKAKSIELGTPRDSLANLRDFGWEGVLVRLGDKFHKLRSFSKDPNADPEKIKKAFLDIAVYGCLGLILFEEDAQAPAAEQEESEEEEGKEIWES